MKIILRLSILFNALLAAGLLYAVMNQRKEQTLPAAQAPGPVVPVAANSSPPASGQPALFRWQQLDAGNDYRLFITNLRAIGCPENTIADIVRGNVNRAFAWERSRQKIDSSGSGLWSEANETELISSLLSSPSEVSTDSSPQGADARANQGTAETLNDPGTPVVQNGNSWVAENNGQSQDGSFYPSPVQTGNRQASSFSGGASSVNPAGQQNEPSGLTQNPGTGPQNNVPMGINPAESPMVSPSQDPNVPGAASPAGPPDPLGPDDPFAKSSEDLMNQQTSDYDTWFDKQASAQAGNGTLNINLASAPQ
jgi:hypothetical protein